MSTGGSSQFRSRGQLSSATVAAFLLAGHALVGIRASAQPYPGAAVSYRSHTGQFMVRDVRASGVSEFSFRHRTNSAYLLLDPTLLTVSSERIKQEIWDKLGFSPPYRGRIYVSLVDAETLDSEIDITSDRFRDGWNYTITLPDLVLRERYLRAMTQVVLLEMANRGLGDHGAELPAWLIAGCVQELLTSKGVQIMLPPPEKNVNGLTMLSTNLVIKREERVELARQQLRAQPPLTFDQLSWPKEESMDQTFEFSSQLFINELFRLKEGREHLHRMIADLPRYLNWQLAFLNAFQNDFERLVDVEKWWTLQVLRFTSREGSQAWPLAESWQKLDDTLRPAVQIRSNSTEAPLETHVTLQTILEQWNSQRREAVLNDLLRDLELMKLRVPREVAVFVERYSLVLNGYLAGQHSASLLHKLRKSKQTEYTKEQAISLLNNLDMEREVTRGNTAVTAAKH